MDSLLSNLRITVPSCLYVKDPESSDLGKKISSNNFEDRRISIEKFIFSISIINETSNFDFLPKHILCICVMVFGVAEYQVVILALQFSSIKFSFSRNPFSI